MTVPGRDRQPQQRSVAGSRAVTGDAHMLDGAIYVRPNPFTTSLTFVRHDLERFTELSRGARKPYNYSCTAGGGEGSVLELSQVEAHHPAPAGFPLKLECRQG